ncbi:MAG: glycosyltransferase [Vicinamibacterales bacterium]
MSSIDWDDNWQVHQRLATELARQGDRVLFVENTGVRAPTWRDAHRVVRRVVNWTTGLRRATDGRCDDSLAIWAPVIMPWPYSRVATSINRRIVERRIRMWRGPDPARELVVWTFLPTPLAARVIGALCPRLTIYYCVDDLASTSPAARRITETERTLLRTADLVFVTSEGLRRHALQYRQQAALLPSAVDVDAFEPADGVHATPDDIRYLRRPIVGYVGGVKEWIDQDLMRAVAQRLPNVNFVLVGPLLTDTTRLTGVPNIHLIGARPHTSIPGYLWAFDVALIPYRMTPYTQHVYPAKLPEYLATGRPIVCTPLPELVRLDAQYPGLVTIAADADGFCAAITKALASADPEGARRRVELARANSWPVRFRVMSSLAEAALAATVDCPDRGAA